MNKFYCVGKDVNVDTHLVKERNIYGNTSRGSVKIKEFYDGILEIELDHENFKTIFMAANFLKEIFSTPDFKEVRAIIFNYIGVRTYIKRGTSVPQVINLYNFERDIVKNEINKIDQKIKSGLKKQLKIQRGNVVLRWI